MDPATWPKVLLALVPRAVIATRQTTMMRASMTAYSTAVGPSSAFRNSTNICPSLLILDLSLVKKTKEERLPPRNRFRSRLTRCCLLSQPEDRERQASGTARNLASAADSAGDLAESFVGAGAQSRDRHQADHDNQGQHHGVFNSRRAVFRLQELNKHLTELAHRKLLP